MTSVFFAILTLGSYARPSSAIPAEYGEAVNDALNQAAQNGGAAGGMPPIGEIQGHMPLADGKYFKPAMPIEQQRFIGIAGKIPPTMGPPGGHPTNPPAFYLPAKPIKVLPRATNTVMFTAAIGIICLNAAWGEPVAIVMCASELFSVAYKVGKEVFVFMAKNMK